MCYTVCWVVKAAYFVDLRVSRFLFAQLITVVDYCSLDRMLIIEIVIHSRLLAKRYCSKGIMQGSPQCNMSFQPASVLAIDQR